MKFVAATAIILVSGSVASAQKAKDSGLRYKPVSPAIHPSSGPAAVGPNNSTANELARIEQQGIKAQPRRAKSQTLAAPTAAPPQDKNKPMKFTPGPRQAANTTNTNTSGSAHRVKVH